jgi:hypothetical protein
VLERTCGTTWNGCRLHMNDPFSVVLGQVGFVYLLLSPLKQGCEAYACLYGAWRSTPEFS